MLDSHQILDFVKFNIINKYIQNLEINYFIPLLLLYFSFTYFINNISPKSKENLSLKLKHNHLLYPIYSVVLKGTIVNKHMSWTSKTNILFSDNLRAMWNHINNMNVEICEMRECSYFNEFTHEEDYEEDEKNSQKKNIFIVDQPSSFYIEDDIFGIVQYKKMNNDEEEKERSFHIENVELILFSFKKNVYDIENYILNVTNNYINKIKNSRSEKRFIYSLKEIDSKESIKLWHEQEFKTTRNFDNMFFKDKEDVLRKIDFFVNNKKWYESGGHPYCLGIGLSGLPGTGKTSFIKALAKYLNRHLVIIPLNKIKTENDFYDAYFDTKYNQNNAEKIEFKDKIIVFEDIDCMSDIVLQREKNNYKNENYKKELEKDDSKDDKSESKSFQDVMLKTVCEMSNSNSNKVNKTDQFTLSFLLNTLDGIFETEGRVLIITSNHYDKLDPALTRPGRIDISLEMGQLDYDIIHEVYQKSFHSKIPKKYHEDLKNIKISPCELVNLKKTLNIDKNEFLKKLLEYQK